ELVAGTTYLITETIPPQGYKITAGSSTKGFKVTMGADGKLTKVETDAEYSWPADASIDSETGTVLTVKNEKNSFTVKKYGEDGETALANTVFTITGVESSGATPPLTTYDSDSTTTYTFTTGSTAGHFTHKGDTVELTEFTGLLVPSEDVAKPNVYKLSEVTPAAGYTAAEDRYLYMTKEGLLFVKEGTGGNYVQAGMGSTDNTVSITDIKNRAKLIKKDTGTTPLVLSGASFTIVPKDSNTFANGRVSLDEGQTLMGDGLTGQLIACTDGKEDHVYTITETAPPAGYTINIPAFDVKMDKEGNLILTLASKNNDSITKYISINNNEIIVSDVKGLEGDITAKDEKTDLSVTKTGTDTYSLAGTTFELKGKFANGSGTAAEAETTITGIIEEGSDTKITYYTNYGETSQALCSLTGKLVASAAVISSETTPAYVYTLTETKPADGYYVHAPIYLCMDYAGDLYSSASEAGPYSKVGKASALLLEPNDLTVENLLTSVSIKKNADGAKFRLYGTFANTDKTIPAGTAYTGASTPAYFSWDTVKDTAVTFTGFLIAGNSYYLEEAEAAPGFVITPLDTLFANASLTDGRLELKVGLDGILRYRTTATAEEDQWKTIIANPASVSAANAVSVTDAKTELYASKADTDTSAAVSGATFTVTGTFYDTEAKTPAAGSKTITSSANLNDPAGLEGTLIVSTGETDTKHTYTVTETAPADGYVLNNPTTSYKVRLLPANATYPNGELQYLNEGVWTTAASGNILGSKTNTILFKDKKSEITLNKTELETPATKVAGAVYSITPASGTAFAGALTSPQNLTTDANGAASLTGAMKVNIGFNTSVPAQTYTYTLEETTPAHGYRANALTDSYADAILTGKAMTICLDDYGVLYYQAYTDAVNKTGFEWKSLQDSTSGKSVLNLKDSQNILSFKKFGTEGATSRSDVTFTMNGVFTDSTDSTESKTKILNDSSSYRNETNAAWILKGLLIAGNSYTLTETVPLPGYTSI
ncbi:MAG TPA: hypothetical protein PLN48_17805, partial [Lachnospiraceae bacterium]|nr:hypothetical protein [Lachnospiraceae bacterium]